MARRQEWTLTTKFQQQAWWLRGILDESMGNRNCPRHPKLAHEYEEGQWAFRAGYAKVGDPLALIRLISETEKGLPYKRSTFESTRLPEIVALSIQPQLI